MTIENRAADESRAFRVADRVLVLGRKGRTDVDPQADQHISQSQTSASCRPPQARPGVVQLVRQVGAVEAAVQERQDHHHEQRHHQQDAGDVAERDADARVPKMLKAQTARINPMAIRCWSPTCTPPVEK